MKRSKIGQAITTVIMCSLIISMMPYTAVNAVGQKKVAVANAKETQNDDEKEENKSIAAEETTTEEESTVSDEDSDAKLDATREDAIADVLTRNPEDAAEPVTIQPEVEKASYTKDVLYDQTILQGIFSSKELFFNIPEYWETKYVYAQIQYDVSELVQSVASSMTFSVNNIPITSYRVRYQEGDTQICYVTIPTDMLKDGYNSFSISAYARLYDENGCIDDYTNANWLSIEDTSFIRCGYETKDANNMISYYPYPFMSTVDESGDGLSIAVSKNATDAEVVAAMNLMADLSTETGKENEIQFCLLPDLATTHPDRTIIVSNYNNLTDEYKKLIKNANDLDQKASVICTKDAGNKPLMLITSKDDDCLLEAAYMLMDENRVSQEKHSEAIVNKGSAKIAMDSKSLSQMVAGNYTVGDIIGSGLTFVGPFHQEQMIYLPFSEDYFLSDAGKVSLKFRYSENLDFNRSLVTIYWGNTPVASKKLTKENATGDELTFSMPADVVGTTTGAIKVAFDLEVPDMFCTPRQEQMPWAYVSDESVLYLPASSGIHLTFDLKPSPFRTDGKFNDMMLVISDNPTTDELNLYAQIIGMYGDGVDPYGTFYVKRASEFSKSDADYNIITAGTYENNKMMKILNESLYFPYEKDGTKFVSNEKLILSDQYAENIAIMQLLESPFASNRGVLAVTGTTNETLETVKQFMRDYDKRYSLSKDCVVIDKDFDTKAFQFISKTEDVEEPGVVDSIVKNKQSVLFTVIATSVMLMMLVAVAIILVRIRMYHKKNDIEEGQDK